MNIDGIIASSS